MTTVILFFVGCGKGSKVSEINTEKVDPVAENIFQNLESGDFISFSKDFSEELKVAFTKAKYDALREIVAEASGKYESKTFDHTTSDSTFIAYFYKCKFEKEEVMSYISFKLQGEEVEGVFFDSPKLLEKQNELKKALETE